MPTAKLEVWLDADVAGELAQVGILHNDRGQIRFEYEAAWLNRPHAFALDPSLALGANTDAAA